MIRRLKAKERIFLNLAGVLVFANLNISVACAQTLDSIAISSDEPIWVYVIIGFVLATLACSAALPLAAIRQWSGAWKACAISPLIALAVWVGFILTAKQLDQSAHPLWMLELFSWSMLNLIFMVTAMTAKRTFEKSRAET
mgnify:CR=1 FL=1|jgi:hypothetical protein